MTDSERALLLLVSEAVANLLAIDAESLDEPPTKADAMRRLIDRVRARDLPAALAR